MRRESVAAAARMALTEGSSPFLLRLGPPSKRGDAVHDRPGISSTESATPVLLIHGGPGGHSCVFDPLADVLSRHRPVIVYDQLGSGRSGRPLDPALWSLDRYVDEIARLRKALGLKRVHLVGHSWGGSLAAQYLIATRPAGVASVVLAGPLLSTERWIADANIPRSQLPGVARER